MKRLYLLRHAKSSWADLELDDFSRPLNKRGKGDCAAMSDRLARAGIHPELIAASPAKRAKKTAKCIAGGTGYNKDDICYYPELYLGTLAYHLQLLEELLRKVNILFLVGHNNTITELAEHLTGRSFDNVPTCGIVGVEYSKVDGFTPASGGGRMLFYDFPKNQMYTTENYKK